MVLSSHPTGYHCIDSSTKAGRVRHRSWKFKSKSDRIAASQRIILESRRGDRASCMALSGVGLVDRRPTTGLAEDGEGDGKEEGEANFTPPTDFALIRGGGGYLPCVALTTGHVMKKKFL
ncbi:hypothetical protein LIER_24138 [Lithospermum erythrorhizon]|uniref:Uncharacterized protein n=1 Tax=Lithospermum erythrorhizon TaxID=34254 RepID=A0AAV3R288_LITER